MGKTFNFTRIPSTLPEFEQDFGSDFTDPLRTSAFTVLALLCQEKGGVDLTFECLDFLSGPVPLSTYQRGFIRERFAEYPYVPKSYVNGTSPEQDYTFSCPFSIEVNDNPYSFADDGYATIYVQSSGADNPRCVKLRQKKSTGEWFLNEQCLMVQAKQPASSDPWA